MKNFLNISDLLAHAGSAQTLSAMLYVGHTVKWVNTHRGVKRKGGDTQG